MYNSINASLTHLNSPTKITDVNTTFHLASHLCTYIRDFRVDTSQIDGNPLILPYDSIKELRLAGLYND